MLNALKADSFPIAEVPVDDASTSVAEVSGSESPSPVKHERSESLNFCQFVSSLLRGGRCREV